MYRPHTASERRRPVIAKTQLGSILLWSLLVAIGAAVGAFVVIYFVVKNVQAQLLVTDESLKAYIDQPLEVTATVENELSISIDAVSYTHLTLPTIYSV